MSEDDLYFFSQGDYTKYRSSKLTDTYLNNNLTTLCFKKIFPGGGSMYLFKITGCQLKFFINKGIPFNPPLTESSPPRNFIVNGVEILASQCAMFNNNTGNIDFFNSNFNINLSMNNTYLFVVFGFDYPIQLPIVIV